MKSETLTLITAVTLFATIAGPIRLAAQEQQQQNKELPRYTVTDLGTLGGTFSAAFSINNRGWVAGAANLPGDTARHAVLWQKGLKTDLGTLGGPNSTAVFPLNERGEIPGYSDTSSPDPLGEDFCGFGTHLVCLPFVWQKGLKTLLPTLGGSNAIANEVNNRGQVGGVAETTTPDPTCLSPQVLQAEPVLWEDGEIQKLPTFPGDPDGFVNAINDIGQAVGASGKCFTALPGIHALLWQRSDETDFQNEDGHNNWTVTDIGNLGGTMNNFPQDINNQGQVVGYSNLPNDATTHAFLWTEDDGIQDLGTLAGDFSSFAFTINSKAQVVGTSAGASGTRAFLWKSGVMTDLNNLILAGSPLFLLDAFGINSRGEIVGDALQTSTGEVHAYLAIPQNGSSSRATVTPATQAESSKVILPEHVRRLLQQRLRIGRFGAGFTRLR
jgi:probable HAF family extracellular repeat protein